MKADKEQDAFFLLAQGTEVCISSQQLFQMCDCQGCRRILNKHLLMMSCSRDLLVLCDINDVYLFQLGL